MTEKAQKYNDLTMTVDRRPAYNSTYKKLAVQWLNEAQLFNQTLVQVESFELRNRQLLIAAKRYAIFSRKIFYLKYLEISSYYATFVL